MHPFTATFCAGALLLTVAASASAGQPLAASGKDIKCMVGTRFEKGARELQVMTGAFFSFTITPSERPTYNDALGAVRAGWMLNDIGGSGILRGNNEVLVEVFGSGIFEGPGSFMAGTTLILRRNFLSDPDQNVVPYFQIGVGGLYNDAYKDKSQRSIGAAFEFNLQASFGVRFFVNESWALTLEGGYRHISNAGLARRNSGLDSLGGSVGLSYLY